MSNTLKAHKETHETLKHKKAAKVWNLRFEFIMQFSAVAKFNKSSESKMDNDVVFEDQDDPVPEKDQLRLQFLETVIDRELDFCMRINKY